MAASVCPIFDEESSFIGIWALNPNFKPSLGTLAELMSLADPTLQALTKRPYRRVCNQGTNVGNGVRFEGGAFLMVGENKAPNEELGRSDSQVAYALINHHGIACLMRCSRSDERIKTPPPVAEPAQPSGVSASVWFKDHSVRGGPHTPADFNLFELPRYSLDDWVHHVSVDPGQARCTVVQIRNVGSVSRKLFEALKADHGLASSDAVDVFDEYLGAACPQCFGGLTGSILQMVGTASSAGAFIGGSEQFQRILSGRCASCDSKEYYVVWHGDKESPQHFVPESAQQQSTKKWWQFWK